MKTPVSAGLVLAAVLVTAAHAQNHQKPQTPEPPPAPVPIYQAPLSPAENPVYVYEQKPFAGGQPAALIPSDQAQAIVDRFRTNYCKSANLRVLIYVNPDLPMRSGDTNAAAVSLTERQSSRDIERLAGHPLRLGGATLVDQQVASHMSGNLAAGTPEASQNRETLGKYADVVIEVLMSSRDVNANDRTYKVPDIQMTAIRLSDARILGQVSAADVMNRAGSPEFVTKNFGVPDVTEATMLALMDDMVQ